MIEAESEDQVSTNADNIITVNTASSPPSSPLPPPPPDLGKFPYPDSSYVPTEIWEYIIDFCYDAPMLYMNDTSKFPHRTWYACATACRSWYHRSRLRLYQNILIASDDQVKRLANCLKMNPRNTEYVLSLHLQSDCHGRDWAHYLVPMLLGSLNFPNLKELAFTTSGHNFVSYAAPGMWLKIGRESHNLFIPSWSKFRGSVRKLSITDIESSSFIAFTRLVLAFSGIEELELGSIDVFPRDRHIPGQYTIPPLHTVVHAKRKHLRLKALRTSLRGTGLLACRWLLASGSFNALEQLSLWRVQCSDREDMDWVHEMLRVVRETIGDISLGLTVYINESKEKEDRKEEIIPLSLHDLPSLHTLSLLEEPAIYGSNKPTITWLITTLSTISSKLLTSLTFRVYLWDFIVKDWDALDNLLISKQFASLKYVKVEAFRIFDEGKGINLGEAMDSEGRALETDDVEGGGGRGFRFLLKKFEQKGKVEVVLEGYDDDPNF